MARARRDEPRERREQRRGERLGRRGALAASASESNDDAFGGGGGGAGAGARRASSCGAGGGGAGARARARANSEPMATNEDGTPARGVRAATKSQISSDEAVDKGLNTLKYEAQIRDYQRQELLAELYGLASAKGHVAKYSARPAAVSHKGTLLRRVARAPDEWRQQAFVVFGSALFFYARRRRADRPHRPAPPRGRAPGALGQGARPVRDVARGARRGALVRSPREAALTPAPASSVLRSARA